jgi:hypothetical protein
MASRVASAGAPEEKSVMKACLQLFSVTDSSLRRIAPASYAPTQAGCRINGTGYLVAAP